MSEETKIEETEIVETAAAETAVEAETKAEETSPVIAPVSKFVEGQEVIIDGQKTKIVQVRGNAETGFIYGAHITNLIDATEDQITAAE